ncbi:vWA domain-containing protein [Hyphomicrobium sp.]|uniref:vWA domain-containing protein n=1 Tax=Hyphomicrobium sp. TaxID=82 RepID=UPI002E35B497|nr:VWA domain-containing protein [Hyphomicrobium sp.]HEX2841482.1 VWA domain-containing protein [Hyphomicrobium sp.]
MLVVRTFSSLFGLSSLTGLAAMCGVLLPQPQARAAEIELGADLGHAVIERKSRDRIYLRLSLKALAAEKREKRTPINVALVIDRSGSMSGERLAAAKKGAEAALERLGSDDIFSLVTYNHEVDVVRPAGRFGAQRDALMRAIGKIDATGTTALYAGVKEGGEQVKAFRSDVKVNRVVLLSDGLANVGPSTPGELAELGRELAGKGISVSTIGLGLEYNEDLMQRLAASSDGNHAFVERPSDLAEIFDREFGDALSVAVRDVTITIECKAGFKPTRVLGRDADISGSKVTLKLAQLQNDNERYVVVELEPPVEGVSGAEAEIAKVGVSYLRLDDGLRSDGETLVMARFTDDTKEAEGSVNKGVMSQVTEQVATENSERAVDLRDKGDLTAARKVLEENALYLNKQKSALGAGAMAAPSASISALDKLEAKSREAAENLDGESWEKTRKMMRQDQHKSKVQQAY